MLTIAILDDNVPFAAGLKETVEQIAEECGYTIQTECFATREQLFSHFAKGEADIIFIDIDLGDGISGIEVASAINSRIPQARIIFMTAYNDYSADISDADFIYYLLKPIDRQKLQKALCKAVSKLRKTSNDMVAVFGTRPPEIIPAREIEYIESRRHAVIYHLVSGSDITVRAKLDDVDENLRHYPMFVRIHKSYIANADHIKLMTNDNVVTDGGELLSIPRSHQKQAREKYTSYMMEKVK